jgi:hypothetical protein
MMFLIFSKQNKQSFRIFKIYIAPTTIFFPQGTKIILIWKVLKKWSGRGNFDGSVGVHQTNLFSFLA